MSIMRTLFVASGLTLLASAPLYVPHAHQSSVSERAPTENRYSRSYNQNDSLSAGSRNMQWEGASLELAEPEQPPLGPGLR